MYMEKRKKRERDYMLLFSLSNTPYLYFEKRSLTNACALQSEELVGSETGQSLQSSVSVASVYDHVWVLREFLGS